MSELLVDFITSLDGYASADGWPGWWGLEGPEYLAWLGEQPEVTYLTETFLPKLRTAGIDQTTIDKLTRENPFHAFARPG